MQRSRSLDLDTSSMSGLAPTAEDLLAELAHEATELGSDEAMAEAIVDATEGSSARSRRVPQKRAPAAGGVAKKRANGGGRRAAAGRKASQDDQMAFVDVE